MKLRIKGSLQVREFIAALPPGGKRRLREAVRQAAHGEREPAALERQLEGYFKLKEPPWRILCRFGPSPDGPALFLLFAWTRDEVYELLAED